MKSFTKLFNSIFSSAAIALPSLITVRLAFGDKGSLEPISILDSTATFQNDDGSSEPGDISPTEAPQALAVDSGVSEAAEGSPATDIADQDSSPDDSTQDNQDSDDDDASPTEDEEDEEEEDDEETEEKAKDFTNREVVWGKFPAALQKNLYNFANTTFDVIKRAARNWNLSSFLSGYLQK